MQMHMEREGLRANLLGRPFWLEQGDQPKLEADEGTVLFEGLHGQLGAPLEISFPNFDHGTELGDAPPRGVQEVAG